MFDTQPAARNEQAEEEEEAEEEFFAYTAGNFYADGGGNKDKENHGILNVGDTRAGPVDKKVEAKLTPGRFTGKDDLVYKEFSPVQHLTDGGGR